MYPDLSSNSSAKPKPYDTKPLTIVRRTQVDHPGHTYIDQARSTFQRSTAGRPRIQRITNEYPGVRKGIRQQQSPIFGRRFVPHLPSPKISEELRFAKRKGTAVLYRTVVLVPRPLSNSPEPENIRCRQRSAPSTRPHAGEPKADWSHRENPGRTALQTSVKCWNF